MTTTKNTIFNLNTIYFMAAIFFLMLAILEKNNFDILYLGLITFYYIRIKKYRSSR